ncbi:MAG TPA: MFS transporter [Pseudonocardiaceae bacterium]
MRATAVDDQPGARRFVAATLIDALGSGLWLPFVLLFLVNAQGMRLTEAGASLSLGALLGLAAGPLSGSLMDRIGPLRVLISSNLIRLVAFACYPLVTHAWHVVLVSAVISVGDRLFWTVNAPIVNALTTERDAERLIGTQTIGRFVGAGVGAGATALIPHLTSPGTYHLLAYLNAASFGIAALLVLGMHVPIEHGRRATQATAGWSAVLRDRPYVGLCATNVLFTLASVGKYSILPILVLDVLHGPHWVPGVALGIGTLTLVAVQRAATRIAGRYPRSVGLLVTSTVFAVSFAALISATLVPLRAAIVVIMVVSPAFAVAEALFAPLTTAAAAAAAPAEVQGRASALYQLSWAVSTVAGPALLTGLLDVGSPVLWATLAVTSAAAAPAVLTLRHRLPAAVLNRSGVTAAGE